MARILVLCSRIPYPPTGGAKLRMYNTAKILADEFEVDLLIINKGTEKPEAVRALDRQFNRVTCFSYPEYRFPLNSIRGIFSTKPLQTYYYHFDAVQSWVHEHADQYNLLYCNHVRTTEYARAFSGKKVVDLVDAISRNYIRASGTGIWRVLYPIEGRRLRRYEQTVIREFTHSFIISQTDKEFIEPDGESFDSMSVVPNGVRPELLQNSFEREENSEARNIVFLGKMDYFPNEDAACYFGDDIFPLVRKRLPDVKFKVVGMNPTKRIKALAEHDGIEVTGYVEEPAIELAQASVVVAPMRYGAGLQNKVLEAMALEKPVLTSSLGREGIDATEGVHLCTADKPDQFAEKLIRLLQSAEKRAELGANARKLIERKYRWDVVRTEFLKGVRRVFNES